MCWEFSRINIGQRWWGCMVITVGETRGKDDNNSNGHDDGG